MRNRCSLFVYIYTCAVFLLSEILFVHIRNIRDVWHLKPSTIAYCVYGTGLASSAQRLLRAFSQGACRETAVTCPEAKQEAPPVRPCMP